MPDTSSLSSATTSVSEQNLWPDATQLQQYEPKELPVEILRAQAQFLGELTNYWLKGLVRSSNLHDDVVHHSFYAYAAYVRQEPFKLFYIKHGIIPWSGVTLVWGEMGELTDTEFAKAESPDELRNKIKELLSRPELLRFIGNLIAMSKQYNPGTVTPESADEEFDSDGI